MSATRDALDDLLADFAACPCPPITDALGGAAVVHLPGCPRDGQVETRGPTEEARCLLDDASGAVMAEWPDGLRYCLSCHEDAPPGAELRHLPQCPWLTGDPVVVPVPRSPCDPLADVVGISTQEIPSCP